MTPMQTRDHSKARAAIRPDWMPHPLVLNALLVLWAAAAALRFLPHA